MRVRLFDLARELGVESKALIQQFRTHDTFISTASAVLTDEQVRLARSWDPQGFATAPETQSFTAVALASANRPRPRPSRPAIPQAMRWYRGEIAPMTRLMMDRKVLPARAPMDRGMPARIGEIEQAGRLAAEWAAYWFIPKEVESWLDAHPQITPKCAADLQRNGLSPEDAAQRIWYGRFHTGRPTLAERVACGDITATEAAVELRLVLRRPA